MPNPDRAAAALAIQAFLQAIGRDPAEPDLVGTGARVADAYIDELCAGYAIDTRELLRTNVIRATSPGLVVVRDVPIATTCPHHLLSATGTATIALHSRDKIVGLGALTALADAHARRLTLQERIGDGIVADVADVLSPAWVGCRVVLSHACMVVRGGKTVGASVETVSLWGARAPDEVAHVHAVLGVGA